MKKIVILIMVSIFFISCERPEYSEMREIEGTQQELNKILAKGERATYDIIHYNEQTYYQDRNGYLHEKIVEDYPHPVGMFLLGGFISLVITLLILEDY